MARAKIDYIPAQVWHITHRCHKMNIWIKAEESVGDIPADPE